MNKKILILLSAAVVISGSVYAQRPLPKSPRGANSNQSISDTSTGFRDTFLTEVVGSYERAPFENGYHRGEISIIEKDNNGVPKVFIWKNQAGTSWHLYNRFGTLSLQTHAEENPYFKQGEQWFQFVFKEDEDGNLSPEPVGFIFGGELYAKQISK